MTLTLRLRAILPWLNRLRQRTASTDPLNSIIQCYGDMIFDLCESILWSPENAQIVFRIVLQELRRRSKTENFKTYERAWVLRITYEKLILFAEKYARRPTASEQIELDARPDVSFRLERFGAYFHRLTIQDQILLLLRDKYGIPYPEISAAMSIPEGSLKISRQQVLRTLEEWIWDQQ